MTAGVPTLDLVAIGRASVDLYGEQVGGRLEDMATFVKAVGGCPANIAIGSARLGLRSALITRVGDEAMGRFIREQLAREGVETRGIRTDPRRLTALVILGVRDSATFPLIFVRENCADAALDEGDIDEALIRSAAATVVTGTHFARANTAAAQRKAMRIAREAGRKVVFDVDYRPNLWGLAGHGAGEERYIRSDDVTGHLQAILPSCDVVVGTEEELHAAGGSEDTLAAIRTIRRLAPEALIVCKRGPMGCVAFPGAIPASLEDGVRGPGFPVEVYNVLGAGDAFMSGFLRGYLRDEPLETTLGYANACGAFAVSRLLCSPESPTWAELRHFLAKGSPERALRKDATLNHIHHATTRTARPATIRFLSIDHGWSDLGALPGADRGRIEAFKTLAVAAAAEVAAGRDGYGLFLDGDLGREALFRAADHPLTVVRQFPQGGAEAASDPGEWPVGQIVKLIANAAPDARTKLDPAELLRIQAASRLRGREVLVEALPGPGGMAADLVAKLGAGGLKPDWWLVEPQPDAAAWEALDAAIESVDPFCRGAIVILRDLAEAEATFGPARRAARLRGFVGGRALFGPVLADHLAGRLDAAAAQAALARRFAQAAAAFDRAETTA
jgi:5-dehydro-2-deoxygluconokinase